MSKGTLSKFLVVCTALLLVAGCASAPKAPKTMDMEAKKFAPDPEVSQVYVYRNEMFGAAISMPVTVNGRYAATTAAKTYFKVDLPAGKHTLTSQGDKSKLTIDTVLGKIYYVWQEVKMGVLAAGSKLQLVDEKTGQEGVKESELINSAL